MGVIVNTTASSGPGPDRSRAYRPSAGWGVALVAALTGSLLLVLGAPRLIAAFWALDARGVVWSVYAGTTVSPAELARASAGLATAEAWVPDGERAGDRSLLLLHQALLVPTPAEQTALRTAAEAAAVSALSVAPVQPSVWARLASLREQRHDLSGAVVALRMSMLSGSFVPALMVPRVEQGLRLLPVMDYETRELLKRQMRLTWIANPEFLVGRSLRPDAGLLVREALADLSQSELAQFQRLHGNRP